MVSWSQEDIGRYWKILEVVGGVFLLEIYRNDTPELSTLVDIPSSASLRFWIGRSIQNEWRLETFFKKFLTTSYCFTLCDMQNLTLQYVIIYCIVLSIEYGLNISINCYSRYKFICWNHQIHFDMLLKLSMTKSASLIISCKC